MGLNGIELEACVLVCAIRRYSSSRYSGMRLVAFSRLLQIPKCEKNNALFSPVHRTGAGRGTTCG
eukprot:2096616-Prymnesium_polylepis.1